MTTAQSVATAEREDSLARAEAQRHVAAARDRLTAGEIVLAAAELAHAEAELLRAAFWSERRARLTGDVA